MKDFQVYHCRNDHVNYVEVGKSKNDCKICGSPLTMIYGVLVRGESADELSIESEYNSDTKSLVFTGIERN